jgi:hypothetical protein
MGAGDILFEREMRKVITNLDSDKADAYVKMLKKRYPTRIDTINRAYSQIKTKPINE